MVVGVLGDELRVASNFLDVDFEVYWENAIDNLVVKLFTLVDSIYPLDVETEYLADDL